MFCDFGKVPEIGTTFRKGNFDYVLIEVEDYVRRDGKASKILYWMKKTSRGKLICFVGSGLKAKGCTTVSKIKRSWLQYLKIEG